MDKLTELSQVTLEDIEEIADLVHLDEFWYLRQYYEPLRISEGKADKERS